MPTKRLIIAVKQRARAHVSPDWLDRVRAIAGVVVEGHGPMQAQITAPAHQEERIRAALGDDFHVEVAVERKPGK